MPPKNYKKWKSYNTGGDDLIKMVHGVYKVPLKKTGELSAWATRARIDYNKKFKNFHGVWLPDFFKDHYSQAQFRTTHNDWVKGKPVPVMMLTGKGESAQARKIPAMLGNVDPFEDALASMDESQYYTKNLLRAASIEPPSKASDRSYWTFFYVHDFMITFGIYIPNWFKFSYSSRENEKYHRNFFFKSIKVPGFMLKPGVEDYTDVVPSSPPFGR